MTTSHHVVIKGTREGLLITFESSDWDASLAELEEHLTPTAPFFAGGQVTLQVGSYELPAEKLQAVAELLQSHGMQLSTVLSGAAATQQATRELGYQTVAVPVGPMPAPPPEGEYGLIVRRTIRSGQVVRHTGTVVVIGDVNPGGEVIAGGDVLVWGRVRGLIHAGAMGNDKAFVCALHLTPTQLRIGSHIARPPDSQSWIRGPETARVQDGRIVVETWEH